MTKNIYFKILSIYINEIDQEKKIKLKNTYDKDYSINIDNNIYHIKSNQILDIPFTNKDLKIVIKLENNSFDFNFDFNKNANGFGSNTFVETENGPIIIKNLKAGDSILDCYGNNLIIENMYIFETSNKSNNKPIIIKKSKCGINLPYEDIIMNIKNTLKIKKIILKGRSLYLNGKGELYPFDDSLKIYCIETENKKDFLLSGFIVESF